MKSITATNYQKDKLYPAVARAVAEILETTNVVAPVELLLRLQRITNMTERLDLAQMCMDKKLKVAALRFWTAALEEVPKLGDNRKALHRYNAACAALLVASGQTKDATPLDERARADLRRRALAWLRAEVAPWTAVFESGSQPERATALSVIRWWTRDVDLTSIPEADALAKLPEAERKDWESFWNEYDALMRKGGESKPR